MNSDPFGIEKSAKNRRHASGSAIAAGGATTAGVGLLAGGIPGSKPNFQGFERADANLKNVQGHGPRKAASMARAAAPATRSAPGGVLGFRGSAHDLGTKFFEAQKELDDKVKNPSKKQAFYHGFNAGKIAPEKKIMAGMKTGQKVAHGAVGVGAAATAYGIERASTNPKKRRFSKADARRKQDTYNGALAGTGAAGFAVSHGGSKFLGSQKSKFANRAAHGVDEAGKLVPTLAGRKGQKMNLRQIDKFKRANPGSTDADLPKSMYPKVGDGDIKRNPKLLSGVSHETAQAAGALRGAAAQHRHFSEVFGSTAKTVKAFRTPSAIVGAAGVGGLVASANKKPKPAPKPIQKSRASAFGVDHG